MATLSNTLLMMPRELPSYLQVAYSFRYSNDPTVGNYFSRIFQIVQRTFALIKEILYYRSRREDFETNKGKLQRDFEVITQKVSENQKPLCIYFVSSHDSNGAILGNHLYYYHHYKIQELQKHFAVAPKLVSSQDEMKGFMASVRQKHADREIKFVDVVCHGLKSTLDIHPQDEPPITAQNLQEDLFSETASDATILLDACLTGLGDRNIADEIARKTPGRKILAPGPGLYFSKPVIRMTNNLPRVISAVHGLAFFKAYECKAFSYPQKMASRYPYVKDQFLPRDIRCIAQSSIFPWLKGTVNENGVDPQRVTKLPDRLSPETRTLILKKICENQNQSYDENAASTFLRENPLHASVRSAFRSIYNELIRETRECPAV